MNLIECENLWVVKWNDEDRGSIEKKMASLEVAVVEWESRKKPKKKTLCCNINIYWKNNNK